MEPPFELDERSVVDRHRCYLAAKFVVFVDEDYSKLPTLYRLPKLHKTPISQAVSPILVHVLL